MIAMRHVRLLCLLIVKMVVCNALLPAPTLRFQFTVHVCSSHSCGAGRRPAIAMTAASEASDPVRCFTSAIARAYCGACHLDFQAVLLEKFVKVLFFTCVLCALHDDQVRINPDKPMRQGTEKAQYRICQDPACTGIVASYGYAHDKKRIRCATHIEEGIILLSCKSCDDHTCNKRALFGQPDTKVSDA
jgi:EsV-1-7 cysteine-rich motif